MEIKALPFTVPKLYLEEKLKTFPKYTTKQEKEILLLEEETDENVLKILGKKASNPAEALAFLIYLRSISVSDVYEGLMECPNCKTMNDFMIEASEILNTDFESEIPIGIFESPDDFLPEEITNGLLVKEINRIIDIIAENNSRILNLLPEKHCRVCKKPFQVGISPRDTMSKMSLTALYQDYFSFGMYLHYGKQDVDELFPFERSILGKMLRKKIETPQL